jgi:hypothetical protein
MHACSKSSTTSSLVSSYSNPKQTNIDLRPKITKKNGQVHADEHL